MFNKVFSYIQDKNQYLYENSLFMKHIDTIILFFILATFISSLFLSTDSIGFLALVVMFLTFINLLVKKGTKLECKGFEIFLIGYFMLVIVSLLGSTLFYLSFKGFLKTLTYMGFYLSLVQFLKDNPSKLKYILYTIVAGLGIESFIAILQNSSIVDVNNTWQDTSYLMPEEVMTRVYGTLQPLNPNLFAGYLIVGVSAIYGLCANFFYKKKNILGFITLALSLLATWATVCTGCRGAYLALFAIFATICAISLKFFWQNYKKWYISIVGGFCVFATTVILAIQSLRMRFLSIFIMREDSSNSFRFNVYQSSLKMFLDNWLLGIGVGNQNFREIYGLYMKTGFDALSTYNIYLEVGVESGLFALICFVGFLAYLIYSSVKYIKQNNSVSDVIFVSLALASIIGVMVHGLVDTVFFRPQIQIVFWLMVAILRVKLYENQNA